MSVTNRIGKKVILPRTGPDEFWRLVQEHYSNEDPLKWKYLAILALRENAGWQLEQIGLVFGHPKGHITRVLRRIKEELQTRFDVSTDFEIDEVE